MDQDEFNNFLAEIDFEPTEAHRAVLDRLLYGTGYIKVITGQRVDPELMGHGGGSVLVHLDEIELS